MFVSAVTFTLVAYTLTDRPPPCSSFQSYFFVVALSRSSFFSSTYTKQNYPTPFHRASRDRKYWREVVLGRDIRHTELWEDMGLQQIAIEEDKFILKALLSKLCSNTGMFFFVLFVCHPSLSLIFPNLSFGLPRTPFGSPLFS